MAEEPIAFGPFRCDPANARIWKDKDVVNLPPKAFDVLLYLLRHPGRLVSKEELLNAVWPETYVGDAVLKVSVGEIRRILEDSAKQPQFIETVHRRGYRFIAPLREETGDLGPETSPPSSPASSLQPLASSFVGRDAELQRLHTLLEKAQSGERQVVFVTGEPGIGKTALVDAFLVGNRQRATGHRQQGSVDLPQPAPDARYPMPTLWIAHGQCLEHYGASEAYLPVLEGFGRLCREAGGEKVVELLKRYAPTWLAQLPALISPAEREQLKREILGATPERMLREMAEAVEALTVETVLILVLEDLHWSDYATLDLVAALARRREAARLLLIGTYRPVDVIVSGHPLRGLNQELQGHGQCVELALDLFSPAQVADYLSFRFSGAALPVEFASVIHRRTDGNPLFLVNFVDYIVAEKILALENHQWQLRRDLERIGAEMPESIRQMIERQIERVSPEEQRLLEAASMMGMGFTAVAVASALEERVERVEEYCERLAQQHQFLRTGDVITWPDGVVTASYRFTHALYQSVFQQRVAAARRLRLHQRFGERLEAGYGTHAKAIAAELALHFEQGRDYARAISYLRQAADQAAQRSANREARQYLSRALGLVGHVGEAEQAALRLAILEQRGKVSRAMGDMRSAAEDFSALATYASELHLVEEEVRALSELATVLAWIDRDECLAAEQRAVALSQDLTDETLRIYICSHSAYWNLLWRGWRQEDVQACTEAVAAARRVGDQTQLGVQLARLCFFLCLRSDYRAACGAGEEGLQWTREVGDVHNYLLCHVFLTRALLLRGRWGETLRVLREGSDMAERNGHQRWALLLRLNAARVYEEAGDFVQAHDVCAQGLQQAQQMPLPYGQLQSAVTLGFTQLGLGQPQQAFATFAELERKLTQERVLMDWVWRIPLCLGLSDYWLTQQDYARARQEAERLCELAAQPGERTYLALGHRMLAEIASAQRKWEDAEQEVTKAFAAFENVEAPLAEWRVCATAARIADQRRRKAQARAHWQRSKAAVYHLADSLERNDPLRQIFLEQPPVAEVLQRS